jgi:hypothetical protein
MKLEQLNCPNCGAPLPIDTLPNAQIECESCGSTFVAAGVAENDDIICPNCQTINTGDKRYCFKCGGLLKENCVLCHTENKVDATHCANCGAHLKRARAERDRLRNQRKRHRLAFIQRLKEKEARQKAEKLEKLLDALDEPENHDMALFQLNQLGVDAIKPLIETLLHDDDPDARYGSARALGNICQQHGIKGLIKARATKALIKALDDSEPAVRYWSSDALRKCNSQTAVEPLAAMLADPHEGVCEKARQALQQLGGERAEQILAAAEKPQGILGWIKGD